MHGRVKGTVNLKYRTVTVYKTPYNGYGFIFTHCQKSKTKLGGCGWKTKLGITIAMRKFAKALNYEFKYNWEV